MKMLKQLQVNQLMITVMIASRSDHSYGGDEGGENDDVTGHGKDVLKGDIRLLLDD